VLIKLCTENKLNDFYNEAKQLLKLILKEKNVKVPDLLLNESIILNRYLLKLPFQTEDLELQLSYNIWEFYSYVQKGTEIPIEGDYTKNWSNQAKRHLKQWKKQNEWEIVEAALPDFIRAYKQSKQSPILKRFFISSLLSREKTQTECLQLFGVKLKNAPHKELQGGLAVLNVPEAKQSENIISFLLPLAKASQAGTGLIDRWFSESRTAGFNFLDFGVFWAPHDPESWKGFTRFKSQFDITYIDHPKPRICFAGSWKKLL